MKAKKIYKDFCYSYCTKRLDVVNKFDRQNLAIIVNNLKLKKLNIFLYYQELFKIQTCKTEITKSGQNICYVSNKLHNVESTAQREVQTKLIQLKKKTTTKKP